MLLIGVFLIFLSADFATDEMQGFGGHVVLCVCLL